ncbi:YwiC-like family protein [Aneurinibacillus sp. Ricciae_BoGa-3]|uniref:YwiC-like family protein n=1 Tax=Aneurinibacillus sp. Ricciae_BoGa-3 TaxID=3022697 RepID=UPI00233FAB9E|nr:YwiC-like family protein [Aneurinibacillus sp. Ricciae_BoGa-3]WCK55490.1 YwiC-like family protein [Aneurinibacillus sp. Ricciae_BoGa-3]
MKLLMPKQHGAWAMIAVPFLAGIGASHAVWLHIPLFLGWLSLYLASYPLLLAVKSVNKSGEYARWTAIYSAAALVFLLPPIWSRPALIWFGVAMIPFLAINFSFAKHKKERAFINDICAVMEMSLGGPASYFAATGQINAISVLVWLLSTLFFLGSVFYVKMHIRERNNMAFHRASLCYHIAVPCAVALTGLLLLSAAYIPSLVRAYVCNGRQLTPRTIGIIEICNSIVFTVVLIVGFRYVYGLV